MNDHTRNSSSILENRYLIGIVGAKKVAFAANLVRDILTFERSQILVLPFYDSTCLGVIHKQNEIIPLISPKKILGITTSTLLKSTLTAIRLNDLTSELSGVGLVVDRMEKSVMAEELSQEYKFQIADVPSGIWQPQR